MKERPILFSAPMVRAILAGTKTQTRRIVKPQPHAAHNPQHAEARAAGWVWMAHDDRPGYSFATGDFRCPYGQPGDRLWVREAFMHEPADYCWEASVSIPCRPAETVYRADHDGDTRGAGWKPSIHMPRALSRITLEITGVRVERLQDISDTDCIAEGIERPEDMSKEAVEAMDIWPIGAERECFNALNQPVHQYRRLWERINGPVSWAANPWVWAIEFRRVTQ